MNMTQCIASSALVMLLMEMVLILEEAPLPRWFLPYNTPCEIVAFMHRIFPAFMNGCRSITGMTQFNGLITSNTRIYNMLYQ